MLTKLAVEWDTEGNAAYSYLVDAIVNGDTVWRLECFVSGPGDGYSVFWYGPVVDESRCLYLLILRCTKAIFSQTRL